MIYEVDGHIIEKIIRSINQIDPTVSTGKLTCWILGFFYSFILSLGPPELSSQLPVYLFLSCIGIVFSRETTTEVTFENDDKIDNTPAGLSVT